jgi:hypothetical protein
MISSTATTSVVPVTKPVEYTSVDAVTQARVMRRSREQEGQPTKRVAPLQRRQGFSLMK